LEFGYSVFLDVCFLPARLNDSNRSGGVVDYHPVICALFGVMLV